jgi:hypothetical protein
MLRKLTAAALAGAVALTTALPTTASAHWYHHIHHIIKKPPIIPPKPPAPTPASGTSGTSGAAGAAAFGGFIAFVGVLAGYDLLRRTTCIGDPWRLGGPGFTEKMPNGNVMIPQCPVKRVAVVKARG